MEENGETFETDAIIVGFAVENFDAITATEIESVKVEIQEADGSVILISTAKTEGTTECNVSYPNGGVHGSIAEKASESVSSPFGVPVHANSGCWKTAGGSYQFQEGDDPTQVAVIIKLTDGTTLEKTYTLSSRLISKFEEAVPGRVYRVQDDGTGAEEFFTTIQAAIDDAETSNGDTIVVSDGEYGGFIVDKELTVKAADDGDDEVVSGEAPVIVSDGVTLDSGSTRSAAIFVRTSNVTIEGFALDGNDSTALRGIGVESGSSFTLSDLNIYSFTTGISFDWARTGPAPSDVLIVDSFFEGNTAAIGSTDGVSGLVIKKNGFGVDNEALGLATADETVVKYNNFLGGGSAITNYTNTAVDASHNWWGTENAGPSESDVTGEFENKVGTTPWLCEEYTGQTNPRVSENGSCEEDTSGSGGGTGGALESVDNSDDESSDDSSSDGGGSSSSDDDDDSDSNDSDDGEVLGASTMSDEEMADLVEALSLATDGLIETFMNLSLEQQMLLADEMSVILAELAEILEGLQ